jgi:hypothetical protein
MNPITKTLIDEIRTAPESIQREVFDFLLRREEGHEDLLPLAQSAWAGDWNSPQEDDTWRDL